MSKERRQKIFNVFSNNLVLVAKRLGLKIGIEQEGVVTELDRPLYICPLCKEVFIEECLDQKLENPLTIEDVPPVKLGGKPLVLTCKICNNTAGTKLDNSLINHLKESAFINIKPYGEVSAKVYLNDSLPFLSKLRIGKNNEYLLEVSGRNPKAIERIDEYRSNKNENKIKFEIRITDNQKAYSALLRIGYLQAFNYFGNQILLAENIQPIIAQIKYPDKKILPHNSIVEVRKSDNVNDGLHIIKEPKKCKSYFSVFTLKLKGLTRQFGVFLPGPDKEGWDNYENIKEIKQSTEMIFHDISFKEMIKNEKLVDGYIQIWKQI